MFAFSHFDKTFGMKMFNYSFKLAAERSDMSTEEPQPWHHAQNHNINTSDCLYVLSGPNRGHYITIVKSHGFWLLFDDDIVEVSHSQPVPLRVLSCLLLSVSKQHLVCIVQKIDAQAIEEFYGLTSDISKNSESGYILFYQSREWRGWMSDTWED